MTQTLKQREQKARMYPCDACGSQPGNPCVTVKHRVGSRHPDGVRSPYSHSSRYDKLRNDEMNGEWRLVFIPKGGDS